MAATRRDALLTLIGVPLMLRQATAAGWQASRETELIVCGWDEVFAPVSRATTCTPEPVE